MELEELEETETDISNIPGQSSNPNKDKYVFRLNQGNTKLLPLIIQRLGLGLYQYDYIIEPMWGNLILQTHCYDSPYLKLSKMDMSNHMLTKYSQYLFYQNNTSPEKSHIRPTEEWLAQNILWGVDSIGLAWI